MLKEVPKTGDVIRIAGQKNPYKVKKDDDCYYRESDKCMLIRIGSLGYINLQEVKSINKTNKDLKQ